MGCNECKKKQGQKNESTTIPLMPENISNGDFSGNFLLKLVAFGVIIIALPFLIIILLGQLFITFFLPKSALNLPSKFVKFFENIIKWHAKRRINNEIKKREEEFKNTTNYSSSDDYEVYETEEYTSEDILVDAETLEWENLSNPKVKEGNNKKGE